MGQASHDDLRRVEDRLGVRIDEAAKEGRRTASKLHDRLNGLDKEAMSASTKADTVMAELVKQGERIDAGEGSLREVHGALKDSTQEFELLNAELRKRREVERAKLEAERETREVEEQDRKDWWRRWWAAATPQNLAFAAAAAAALSAFAKGQMDQSDLLDALAAAEATREAIEASPP